MPIQTIIITRRIAKKYELWGLFLIGLFGAACSLLGLIVCASFPFCAADIVRWFR